MARILYGVAGEGMGHAVRSKAVIDHLKKKHEVRIVAAGKAHSFLLRYSPVEKIDYFKIIYRNNKTAIALTALNNTARFPLILLRSLRIGRLIRQFKPNLIITDFEPLVDYYAFFKKIPVISIDNQHLIPEANHDAISKNQRFSALVARLIVRLFIIKKNACFITAIVPAKSSSSRFHLIEPLLRKEIIEGKPMKKEHILVYQTSTSNKDLVSSLQRLADVRFLVYGLNENKKMGNVTLKKASEKEFLEDLRTCRAVITNGGFTLISEAIHLKKPILSVPVKNHFEQFLNAMHVHMCGFGMYGEDINEHVVSQFLDHLPEYEEYLKKHKKYSNKEAFRLIDKEIKRLTRS